jgi:multiple sugar transport system permease protein
MPASRLGAVVLWLAAAFCCGVAVFPPLWAAVLSLTPADRVGGTLRISAWTLENYADVFAQPTFWRALLNSFLAALGTTLAALGLGIPAAYALTRVTDRLAGASLVILAVRMVP